jgi:autotransporter-associated beta strand protein
VPSNIALFAGADGTYAVTVAQNLAAQQLAFSNSGYTLSAAAAQTITLNNNVAGTRVIDLAAGKAATIGTNVTLAITGPASPLIAFGSATSTLNVVGGKITSSINNTAINGGGTLDLGVGGVFEQTSGSFAINGGSMLRVNGGAATFAANLILNSAAGSGMVTLVSGSITTPASAASGGVRFGGSGGSGVFNLDGGTLFTSRIYENNAAVVSTFNFNGGVLRARANNDADFMTGLDNAVVKAGGAVIDTDGFNISVAQALTHDSSLGATPDGGLTKNGNGRLSLNASNSYTGNTTINAGTLNYGNLSALGAGTVTFGGNATLQSGLAGTLANNMTLGNDVTAVVDIGANATTLSGVISGGGALVKRGTNNLTLTASNSFTGGTTLSGANNIELGASQALGRGALQLGDANTTGTIRLRLNGHQQTITGFSLGTSSLATIENQGGGNGVLTIDQAEGTTSTSTTNFIFRNQSAGTGTLGLTKTGAGTLDLSAVFSGTTYSGGLTVNAGTVAFGAATNAVGSGAITLGGGTLRYTATGSTNRTLANSFALASDTTSSIEVADSTVALGISDVISGGGALTKAGAGTMVLSGANTYSGGTILGLGTLRLDHVNAAGSGTITQSNASSTLQINTTGTVANAMSIYNISTLQTVTLSGNKTLGNATFTVAADTTTTESGVLSGPGGITKAGAGTLVVTASNSFTGNTVVNAGVLNLNSTTGSALGASTNVTVSATLLISQSGQVSESAVVTLSGGTIQRGAGVSEVFGNLNITGSGILDFGTDAVGNLTFGTYQDNEATPSALLTLNNFLPGNSFTFSSTSFTTNSVGNYFTFGTGYAGSSIAESGSTFTITAIPEPSTYLAAAGLLGLLVLSMRRRAASQSPQSPAV